MQELKQVRAYFRQEGGSLEIQDVFRDVGGTHYTMHRTRLVPTDEVVDLKGWPDAKARIYKCVYEPTGDLSDEILIPE